MSGLDLRMVDAIGPFFGPVTRRRLNWSKIPFHDLPVGKGSEEAWAKIGRDLDEFTDRVLKEGFNALTLDDVAHLTDHPWYEPEVRERIQFLAVKFRELIERVQELGARVFVTTDVITLSPKVSEKLGRDWAARRAFYLDVLQRFFEAYPEVEGVILRIGESDGLDVHDRLRSELHLRTAKEANGFLKELLPVADAAKRKVILRTWTVGAHRIGDLIWRRGTLAKLVEGISSENFILSMKPGDSGFFRYLSLNEAFLTYHGPKILELQARPEYEGAGELPSFLGFQYEEYHRAMKGVKNLIGISVWCQTGGWHRFRRMSFLGKGSPWVELNVRLALKVFHYGKSAGDALYCLALPECFFRKLDRVIHEAYYLPSFAFQNLYFRRVRIPPLLHVYWDTVFIIAPVRKLMRFFVADHAAALAEGEVALEQVRELLEEVGKLSFPDEDMEFLQDTLEMIGWARRYFFGKFTPELSEKIEQAKRVYKKKWPKSTQGPTRFRIRTDFQPFHLKRRTLKWGVWVMLRRRQAYRFIDYAFVLTLLGACYRIFRRAKPQALPEFVQNSAMGVDSIFE